jgi:hypothetical protein
MRSRLAALALLASIVVAGVAAEAGALPDKAFTIRKGHHYDTTCILGRTPGLHLSGHTDRTLTFKALFHPDAAYFTSDPANQGDWCKLMGISTLRIHHNSIRLGWRYVPATNKIGLGFYGYVKGQRIMPPIAEVDFNQWVDVEIRMWSGGESVTVNGAKYETNASLGFSALLPTPTVILDTAYFGGDETAPHDIHIDVKDVSVR